MAATTSASDLSKLLENWNPMQDVYSNLKLNQYDSGPGANMAPVFHASHQHQQQLQYKNNSNTNAADQANLRPFLIFDNVPSKMKEEGMRNLCSRYGQVTAVRFNNSLGKFFVDCKTVSDMEGVFRALEQNEYGFKVRIGKHFNKKPNDASKKTSLHNTSTSSSQQDAPDLTYKCPKQTGPDFENRNWELSSKQHPRPKFEKIPIVRAADYENPNNLLAVNDPKGWYCIEDDPHAHEAKNFKLDKNSYRNGRTYLEMPQDLKENIMDNKKKSDNFNNTTKHYVHVQGNAIKPTNIGMCENCGLESDMSCCRCNTYYCSRECQTEAWPKHRLLCVRLAISKSKLIYPDLEEKNDNEENAKSPIAEAFAAAIPAAIKEPKKKYTELPASGENVVVISISKANVVFVRAKNKEADLKYFKLLSKVHAEGANFPKLLTLPVKGQIVVAQFEGQYNRAMVLNTINHDKIRLIYLEFGNLDVKSFDELYAAPASYAELEKLVTPVLLKNVSDCYITVSLRAFMYSKLENVVFKLKYNAAEDFHEEKGAFAVELIDTISNQNLNQLISKVCYPVAKKNVDFKCFENSPAMKTLPLPTGKNIELVVMDNSLLKKGVLYCTTESYALEIQKFHKDLQVYGENNENEEEYAPAYLELCVVKYELDKQWYRGVGLENVGDGFPTIQFLDYGNTAAVPLKNIRRYPEQFLIPKFTSSCEINGLLKYFNGNLLSRLEELLPVGKPLLCNEVLLRTDEEDNEYYELNLSNIEEQLKQEGLLFDPKSEID